MCAHSWPKTFAARREAGSGRSRACHDAAFLDCNRAANERLPAATAGLHDHGDETDGDGHHHPHGALGEPEELDDADGHTAGDDHTAGQHETDLRAPAGHGTVAAPRSASPLAITSSTSRPADALMLTTSGRAAAAQGRQARFASAKSATVGVPTAAARWVTPESLPIQSATCARAPASAGSGGSVSVRTRTDRRSRSAATATWSAGPS